MAAWQSSWARRSVRFSHGLAARSGVRRKEYFLHSTLGCQHEPCQRRIRNRTLRVAEYQARISSEGISLYLGDILRELRNARILLILLVCTRDGIGLVSQFNAIL